jgi:hypothetical protein
VKLSEAIHLGSMLRPQIYGDYAEKDGGTCAMGAALDAVGKLGKSRSSFENRLNKIWPWLAWRLEISNCPYCGGIIRTKNIHHLIIHLNDKDKISRVRIAELIGRVEKQATDQLEPNPSQKARAKLADLESHLTTKRKRKEIPHHGSKKSESASLACSRSS